MALGRGVDVRERGDYDGTGRVDDVSGAAGLGAGGGGARRLGTDVRGSSAGGVDAGRLLGVGRGENRGPVADGAVIRRTPRHSLTPADHRPWCRTPAPLLPI